MLVTSSSLPLALPFLLAGGAEGEEEFEGDAVLVFEGLAILLFASADTDAETVLLAAPEPLVVGVSVESAGVEELEAAETPCMESFPMTPRIQSENAEMRVYTPGLSGSAHPYAQLTSPI